MAKFIHIETATKVCSVALSEDGKCIDLLEEESDRYIHSECLTLFIEKITQRNQWKLKDHDAIVVTSGPGSYTGLRIGVSTAKGLCYALKKPLIAVNTLESIAAIAHQKYPEKTICALIDARRMEVFSTIFNVSKEVIKPLSADIIEGETYTEFEPFVACGDGASKLKQTWEDRDVIFDEEIHSSAAGQVEIAFTKWITKETEDVAYFVPLYLKDFVATTSKKKQF